MKTFKQFITEHFINVFTPEQKEPYVDQVWELLQKTYAYAGGIKGSGFKDKQDMIDNIPMWKLVSKDGKIITARMYKDKDGRKIVASGTDGSKESIKSYRAISKEDLKRAYVEVSDKPLESLKKTLGADFFKYAVSVKDAQKKMPDDELIPVDDYYYKRLIGGVLKTKIMMGNINAEKITFTDSK
jgi:hypothetical protein